MTRPLVMKFGGTSMASATAIAKVVGIVSAAAQRNHPVVVVVSAMSGVTDELLAACTLARGGDGEGALAKVADIESRHQQAIEEIFRLKAEATSDSRTDSGDFRLKAEATSDSRTDSGDFRLKAEATCDSQTESGDLRLKAEAASESRTDSGDLRLKAKAPSAPQTDSGGFRLQAEVTDACEELRAVLTSVAVLRELTPRGADRVAAAGELMSSRIAAAALRRAGVPARWVDARRAIVTDDAHPAAAPLMRETRASVAREIRPITEAGEVAVLGGFVGATAGGITTTLGRGGSDYSASIVGAALHASEIQIWTDVDGMLTADPRVVENAQLVAELSFDEASELAYFGAKVLHPSTIVPAVEDGIPVRILNTMRPAGTGSLITARASEGAGALTALACKRNISVVDITSTRMLLAHGFLRRVFEVFEQHATSVDVVTTSEVSVSVTLDDDRRLEAIARDLQAFAEVQVDRGMSILSAVGDNLRRDPALAGRLIASLGGLPLRMVSQAASRRNITVVLNDRDLPAAMARLHEAFFVEAEVRR